MPRITMSDYALYLMIEGLRGRLERTAQRYPRTHPRVVAISQRLDKYIVEAQRRAAV